jgi:Kef-type K+ transport system membrane component KefB
MLIGQLLLQLIVILVVVQIFGIASRRIGQQWVIGEILAGLALGPSLFGAIWPNLRLQLFATNTLPFLQVLGEIGLMLYMFSLGARLDTGSILRQGRVALFISLSGILLPLISGMILGYFLYPTFAGAKATQQSFMLLMGTAMAITAFPVLARLLVEKKMLGVRVGTLALTCASVDDVIAWCLLAFVVATIDARASSVVYSVGLTLLFIGVMFFIVRPLLAYAARRIRSEQWLIALSVIVLLTAAYITNAIGIHSFFGAFLAGVILPSDVQFTSKLHSLDQMNSMLFLPLYFVLSGLRTQVGLIQTPSLWLICLLVFAVACLGKIFGGALAARVQGESWREACCIGILMNTRGLVELIVLNIGLELGVLSPTMFTMLVIMAIITTMMASPLLPLFGYSTKEIQNLHDNDLVEQAMPLSPGE